MIALLIILALLVPLMTVAAFYSGIRWENLNTPKLGKLKDDNKRLRKENDKLQNDLKLKTWLNNDRVTMLAQIERYKAAAESHQLKPAAECSLVPFKESFCGTAKRLSETIKSTLSGTVHQASAGISCPDAFSSPHDSFEISGTPAKIGGDVQAFLTSKGLEEVAALVTISGTYRKPYVEPPVQLVTVIETIREPVIVPVSQNLPLEIQEFLDHYPDNERLKLLEAAAEFRSQEK